MDATKIPWLSISLAQGTILALGAAVHADIKLDDAKLQRRFSSHSAALGMMAVTMILAEWYVSVLVTALYGPSVIIPWMIVAQLFFMMLFFYLPFEYIDIQARENEREEVKHLIIPDDEETLVGDVDYDCGQSMYAESLSSFGYEGDDVWVYGTMDLSQLSGPGNSMPI
ncbi:uncharacterized protein FIESC28_07343 [Fusarium coffeatum]|uniref:Uncharacterized protein n=1 Tax=Fusarium coffeatum TaxID=231269 RepID=A0A366RFT0_9HYPO|nr:uncharacterized protein FIESC28_07343 [Fusarium coffeatum]RBR15408.1 hypothetical protein FIESC28_07343 [Fusarium coffeatum]